jgi:hypothetical protein
VFGIVGHIEISTSKSKTRQRRLVEICPALEQRLTPYRGMEGKVTSQTLDGYTWQFKKLRERLNIPSRKNGLRHAFCHLCHLWPQTNRESRKREGPLRSLPHFCHHGGPESTSRKSNKTPPIIPK